MKVTENNKNTDYLFNLNEGDVFKLDDDYYIACFLNYVDHYREVFDIRNNTMLRFGHNSYVKVWRSDNVKLILEEAKT